MEEKYLDKLEFNKITGALSSFSKTYLGKALAENLKPYFNSQDSIDKLAETTAARSLIEKNGTLPLDSIPNISIWIKHLESYNDLTEKGLLEVAYILKSARELKDYFKYENETNLLYHYFESLYSNESIEKNILDKILDENTISDNASPKLLANRRTQKNLASDIKNKLNSFIHSSTYSKYLQDAIVTYRNDRFVVPVKEEYRSQIKGFIHDTSSSGSTVYIEPIFIFEMNNEIANLKIEENLEISRILNSLTKLCIPIVEHLKSDLNVIGYIDFTFAKAKYSIIQNATEPAINNDKIIKLITARHPLIDKEKIVPIDIELGNGFRTLIITGPNTGGKTVALKTVGLLLAMVKSGLHIPVSDHSTIFLFDNIFADIGDEQSISESLSTFSAHIVNIIDILSKVTSNSLVLLDELGSGTDPIEGSYLAISILEKLHCYGTLTIASTHYQELKNYALVTEGFENASFEFNIDELTPTYKLIIGLPGKSNAFEICTKLGLDSTIISRAHSLMDDDSISIEELLKNIYNNKIKIEKEQEEVSKNLNQIEILRKKLEHEYTDKQDKALELVERARTEARDILLDAKDEASAIIRDLNKLYNHSDSIKEANNLRNSINDKIKTLSQKNSAIIGSTLKPEDISLNMNVLVIPFNKVGTIISLPNSSNEVTVQIGALKTSISISKLEKTHQVIQEKKQFKSSSFIKSNIISSEINVIGLNVEDAIQIIDKYLDDAYISKLEKVRIVHGKGTGKLRQGVQAFLKKHPHVKEFHIGAFGEGEMGVTIVTLKK